MAVEPEPTPYTASSARELERFCAFVLSDKVLQESLVTETDADKFIQLVVETAVRRGFNFGADDVTAAIRANRMALMMRRIVR